MPQFSIIIPAFNAAATIARAIDSVLAQTFTDYEIIVVNDGSTDATLAVLERYAGRIGVVTQENSGPARARNAAAHHAQGAWFAFLDADDTWTADKLEKIGDTIAGNREAVLVFSDATCIDSRGTAIGAFLPPQLAHAPSRSEVMAGRCQILTSTAVVRRDAFEAVGGFAEEFRGAAFAFEDVFLWVRLAERGPFAYFAVPLVNYRVTPLITRLERYRPGFAVFTRLVHRHYGTAGEQLIRARRAARASLWARAGFDALAGEDIYEARYAFRNAIREDPRRAKNLLRLLRTFLPRPLARALSKPRPPRSESLDW